MNRRDALKLAGAGAISTGLSGCSSFLRNGSGTTLGGTNSSAGSVSFDFWDIINVQSRSAREFVEKQIGAYEDETGNTVNTNFSGYGELCGQKWVTDFGSKHSRPILYDSTSFESGKILERGYVKPLSEYEHKLDDEVVDSIEWLYDQLEEVYRPYDGDGTDGIYEIPYSIAPKQAHVARTDHIEEAGLSVEDDYHDMDGYDHLLEVCGALEKNAPSNHPYAVYGTQFDCIDVQLPAWAVAEGGADGLYLNEDGTDANFDNDVWKTVVRQYVELATEHGYTPPNTAQLNDENSIPALISGDWSMGSADFVTQGEFLAQGEDMMNDGTIQWATMWPGDSGQKGFNFTFPAFGITRKPDGVNEATWERKEDAAIEFINRWFSRENQKHIYELVGRLPVRKDTWSDLPSGPHNHRDVLLELVKNSDHAIAAHPAVCSFYGVAAPHLQKALNGEITPETACEKMAEGVRELL